MGVPIEEAGLVTTPQLHFAVHARNNAASGRPSPPASIAGLYFDTLVGAFERLVEGLPPAPGGGGALHVDCANGVGASQVTGPPPSLVDGTSPAPS